MAYLVYPGATHTRFDHSLGAFHVAGGLVDVLADNQTDKRLVRLAVLLHDVGHGPFSHVAEPILRKHSRPEVFAGQSDAKIHELIGAKIITENPELKRYLSDKDREHIVGLLEGSYGHRYLHEIVSGPVDSDKQDYLLRDSYFTGVKYGIYDQQRLKNTLLKIPDDSDDVVLAIAVDGIHSLEQFVLAKYYMTTQVYRHRLRLITDEMIKRAITVGIEVDKIGWLRSLFSYDGSDAFVDEYLKWNDERLVNQIVYHQKRTQTKDLFDRLKERRLFKCIFEADQTDFANPHTRNFVFVGPKDFYTPLEDKIARHLNLNPHHVIVNRFEFNSATETESEIPVVHPTKTTVFAEESALFASVDQEIREQHFHVYAPMEYDGDEIRKKKVLRELKEVILGMINDLADPQGDLPLKQEAV